MDVHTKEALNDYKFSMFVMFDLLFVVASFSLALI